MFRARLDNDHVVWGECSASSVLDEVTRARHHNIEFVLLVWALGVRITRSVKAEFHRAVAQRTVETHLTGIGRKTRFHVLDRE